MIDRASGSPRVTACITAIGAGGYHRAAEGAARSVLEHTDWDLVLVADRPLPAALSRDPRVSGIRIDPVVGADRAGRFLAKFDALERAIGVSDTPLMVLLDADARVVRRTTGADVAAALAGRPLGMVEQAAIRGSSMNREAFLEHYRVHALGFIDPAATPPELDAFRYYNSGVVLAQRDALAEVVRDSLERIATATGHHAIGEHMIADQDYFQHWVLNARPGSCTDLGWEWNHCAWWHEPFPRDGARILHFSNFTDGPTPETLAQMDATCARVTAGDTLSARVSAVVVTYRSEHVIEECARALHLAGVEHVIVVDNASDDETVARARAAGCDVVELPRNHGFAVAANAGLRLVATDVVCFINPDCLADVATVRRGAELCSDDSVCAVPDFVDDAGEVTLGVRRAYTRRRLLADVARTHSASSPLAAVAERGPGYDGRGWAWPLGACVFLPTVAMRRIGGFDEAYFLYMEDVDLGRRWCADGGRIVSTGTVVRHAQQQGADVEPETRGALLAEARVQYGRRTFGPLTVAVARMLAGSAA